MKRISSQSQYFLRSPQTVLELIGHTNIKKTDVVLDIGAGSGVITKALSSRCATVITYENDSRLATKLQDNLSSTQNVTIIIGDFLEMSLPDEPFKVFANIPFHLSSPILKKLTLAHNRPQAIYLITQKQFANKLLINDRRFTGLLGATIAPLYSSRIRKTLKKTDFSPRPAVDTVLVELLLRDEPLIQLSHFSSYQKFITDCFSDPKIFVRMPKLGAHIDAGLRPSQLTADQWVNLFELQSEY
jgi:16S rRNA A1518/A1519 N6-dimethyltransferase RsmA/KsgA/DIM1 with predicted DNA glycosylase/AP lyase activity